MFDFEGMPDARMVPWSRLEPGMIFLSGLTVNGAPPEELRDYPILDAPSIAVLRDRYKLRKDRNVQVLLPGSKGLSPLECVDAIHEAERKVSVLNNFRHAVGDQRRKFGVGVQGALASSLVRDDSLIFPYGDRLGRPTLLSKLDFSLKVADLFFEDFRRKFRFPEDEEMDVHLVVDYSYSMKASGRDAYAQSAVNLFFTGLRHLFTRARFHLYGFSDDCRSLSSPIAGDEVSRKETQYGSFLKEIFRQADERVPNVILLFTDGLPTDRQTALSRLATARNRGLDYIQVVFDIEGDKREFAAADGHDVLDGYLTGEADGTRRLTDAEYNKLMKEIRRDFGELAETAGGGQVILKVDEALALVSVEGFDRWLGGRGGAG